MRPDEAMFILSQCEYKPNWCFVLGWDNDSDDRWLQVVIVEGVSEQRCRKWRLSEWMTTSEIVQTAFAAVLFAEEHEAREAFTYRGAAIFGPHFDVVALAEAVKQDTLTKDVR